MAGLFVEFSFVSAYLSSQWWILFCLFVAAFTIFSACEYLIAIANILFHFTAVHEFGDASWCLLDGPTHDHHTAIYCGKDTIYSASHNGPTLNRRVMSVKDYDNNDRKKLCWAPELSLRSSVCVLNRSLTKIIRGVRNPMQMSGTSFLKTEPNWPQNTKTENLISVVWFSKTDFGGLRAVFHIVSFRVHLPAW